MSATTAVFAESGHRVPQAVVPALAVNAPGPTKAMGSGGAAFVQGRAKLRPMHPGGSDKMLLVEALAPENEGMMKEYK
jgi:hypothetical protein